MSVSTVDVNRPQSMVFAASGTTCPLLLIYYPQYNSWKYQAGSERDVPERAIAPQQGERLAE